MKKARQIIEGLLEQSPSKCGKESEMECDEHTTCKVRAKARRYLQEPSHSLLVGNGEIEIYFKSYSDMVAFASLSEKDQEPEKEGGRFWKKERDDYPLKHICSLYELELSCMFDGGCGACPRYNEWKNGSKLSDLIKKATADSERKELEKEKVTSGIEGCEGCRYDTYPVSSYCFKCARNDSIKDHYAEKDHEPDKSYCCNAEIEQLAEHPHIWYCSKCGKHLGEGAIEYPREDQEPEGSK